MTIFLLFSLLVSACLISGGTTMVPLRHEDECPVGPLKPFLLICKNGTVLRDTKTVVMSPVPPSFDVHTHVNSIDISLVTQLHARIYFPRLRRRDQKLPILVYFHGGGFCIGSSADAPDHAYHNRISSEGPALVVSVDYRLFPEYLIPAAYDDSWSALQWVASLSNPTTTNCSSEVTSTTITASRRLSLLGDFTRVFIGGDSAGANIAHNLAIRAGFEPLPNNVQIAGAFLAMPYFLGSVRVPLEPSNNFTSLNIYMVWKYVCPASVCVHGVDDPRINPMGPGAPSLEGLRCGGKLMVYVADRDELKGRGRWYVDMVKSSGWQGDVKLYEAKNGAHVFQVFEPTNRETNRLIRRLSAFLYS